MQLLYPTIGRGKTGSFRWKYTGRSGFLVACHPLSFSSFRRAVKWFFGQRRRDGHPIILSQRAADEYSRR